MTLPRSLALIAGLWAMAAQAQEVTVTLPEPAEDLRGALEGAALSLTLGDTDMTAPQDYVAAARADYRRLLSALYSEGYYGGTVSIRVDGREAAEIAPLVAPARVARVEITVDPGPRFSFGRAVVAPLAPGTVLPDGFASGAVAQSGVIRQAVAAGVDGWREVGHAKAAPGGQQIVAQHASETLDVDVALAPGPRLTFGPLSVNGNQRVRTERIVEIAGLPVGRVYSPADIAIATARLRRAGAFQSVALVEADAYTGDFALPMELQVIEMKPRRLGFGAELSSHDGLALTAYWLHRNLLGGAERFRVEADISGIGDPDSGPDLTLGATFGRPATFNADTDFQAAADVSRLDAPDYLLTRANVQAGFVKYVRDDLTYEANLGLLVAHEETAFRTRDYVLATLPLRATLDRRDVPLDAQRGYYIDLQATPFLAIEGGDSGVRLYADARAYRSFGEGDRFTFAARAQVGSVIGASNLDAPTDFLFYSGGGGTVRGQRYNALAVSLARDLGTGPVEGARIGGASFAGGQFEARIGITDRIEAVGFYDYGYVSADAVPLQGGDWHAGAGIGLRYDTPIGPVRLDLATPASGDKAGQELQIYLGIGQSF
ncbi:MAG: outer membrane protein assembly factor [Rhodobacterales bacterium]|nr:outer membrane protein assembly factor [Rhodobacterales bacterium]